MRRFLSVFVMLTAVMSVWAQDFPMDKLNSMMARFYDGAMLFKDGMKDCNVYMLQEAAKAFDDDPINKDCLVCDPLYVVPVNVADTVSLNGKIKYSNDCVNHWIKNCAAVGYVDAGSGMRASGSPVQIGHFAIKAGGSIQLRQPGVYESVNLVLIAQPQGQFSMAVTDSEGNPIPVNSYEGGEVLHADGPLPDATDLMISITNNGVSDASFALISD